MNSNQANGAIIERKARPIYDSLNRGDFKVGCQFRLSEWTQLSQHVPTHVLRDVSSELATC
jgi:hypothetical protein